MRLRLDEVGQLHYIASQSNLRSILELGILSHVAARGHEHVSVANESVQRRRARRKLQMHDGTSLPLHSYANLYFCPRNPMMYCLHHDHERLCVIGVAPGVLRLEGVVIADGNAAAKLTRFYPSPAGRAHLDAELVFARSWDHEDPIEKARRKRIKCAEVLVPERVDPEHIVRVTVSSAKARARLAALVAQAYPALPVEVDADVFFLR